VLAVGFHDAGTSFFAYDPSVNGDASSTQFTSDLNSLPRHQLVSNLAPYKPSIKPFDFATATTPPL